MSSSVSVGRAQPPQDAPEDLTTSTTSLVMFSAMPCAYACKVKEQWGLWLLPLWSCA